MSIFKEESLELQLLTEFFNELNSYYANFVLKLTAYTYKSLNLVRKFVKATTIKTPSILRSD